MFLRLVRVVAAVSVAAVLLVACALTLTASAGRAAVDPQPYLDPTYENQFWDLLVGTSWPAGFPPSWAVDGVWRVQVAAGTMPPLRNIGTLGLDDGRTVAWWRVDRGANRRLLRVAGSDPLGRTTGGAVVCSTPSCQALGWRFYSSFCSSCDAGALTDVWGVVDASSNVTYWCSEVYGPAPTPGCTSVADAAAYAIGGAGASPVVLGSTYSWTTVCNNGLHCVFSRAVADSDFEANVTIEANEPYVSQTVENLTSWSIPAKSAALLAAARARIASLGPGYENLFNYFLDPVNWPPPWSAPPEQTYGPPDGVLAENPSGSQAEPVNTATGAYWTQVRDLSLPGIGLPVVFERSYNSSDQTAGALGPGWTHAYAAGLTIAGNGDVTVRGGTGQRLVFVKQTDGSFVAAPGALSSLTLSGGVYELRLSRGQLRYAFDAQGRLTSIKDRNNNTVTLAYAGGLLSQITDTVGRQITVSHSGGLISSVSVPDGRHVDFGYTGGRLTSVVDVRGKTWSYEYDAGGRLSKITDPNGHFVVRNTYGIDGRVTDQDDARGYHTTFSWDAASQTATMTDARGKQWRDVYNNNVLWKRIDPLGNTVRLERDASLRLAKLVDARGNATTMTYDAAGNMLTATAPAPLSYQQVWTYNARNDIATYTDGRGGVTTFGYDTPGNLTSITYPDPDAGGPLAAPVEQFGRDPSGNGLLASYTDPRSKTWTLQYTGGLPTQLLSPLGFKTTYGYDGAGRVTSIVEPRGYAAGNTPTDYTTTYTYDAAGNPLTTTTPDPDGTGSLIASTWTATYDLAGLLDTTTDPKGHLTDYGYDEANHLTQVVAPDPDGAGGVPAPVTSYTYNETGDLASRTDANAHVTSYAYDDARRLTQTTAPLGRVWTYTYDANGNLASVTDANGNATPASGDGLTGYGYDVLDRLTGIDYADATPDVGYSYDANSNRTQMTDGSGSEAYAWDALDRLTSLTRGADVLAYQYDAASNLTKRTYPGSIVADLVYDNDGRLQSVTSNSLTTTYGYDQAGNLLTTTLPSGNGHVDTRVYDRAGRLTDVWNKKGSTTLSRFVLTLDADGNPTKIVRSGTPSETRTYAYDNLDRLTEVCFQAAACTSGSSPFVRWTYDGVGNRLTEARPGGLTTSYSYDAADRLLSAGATSYAFDANGNQTAAGARTFVYDLANRLKNTTLSGTTTSYLYDGDGRRLRASTGAGASQITNYVWDVTTPTVPQLALERDGGGTLLRRYLHGADVISMTAPSSVFYVHHDDLGSVMNVTSSTGAKQWTYTYEPYGVMKTETKNNNNAPANMLKFAGEQQDPTGLYHLRARQYDPATGRFATADPLSPPLNQPKLSVYSYADDRPTTRIDPTGRASESTQNVVWDDSPGPTPDICGSLWCWIKSGAPIGDTSCIRGATATGLGVVAIGGGSLLGGVLIAKGGAEIVASPAAGTYAPFVLAVGVKEVGEGVATAGLGQAVGAALIHKSYESCGGS